VTRRLPLKRNQSDRNGSLPLTAVIFLFQVALSFGTPFPATAFPDQHALILPPWFSFMPASSSSSQSQSGLARGKFLVASRGLGDPNFAETVVLLVEYSQNGGAIGVVINRPAEVQLSTLLPNVKELQQRTDPAYIGGPVGRSQMLILAHCKSQPPGSLRVFEDVYTIPGQAALERIIHEAGTSAKFRAYLGYAGWAAGQLDSELAQGGWHVVPANAATVFDQTPTAIWPELIRRGEAQWVRSRKGEAFTQQSRSPSPLSSMSAFPGAL